jgi:hypothetical protein
MLKAHLSRGHAQKAQALLREMAAHGLQANKVTYNELLHAKVIAKDCRGIWQVVEEMRHAGVKVNSVTCSILLKSLTTHSSIKDVKHILLLIDEVEEQIDEVLYASAVETLIRIKQLDALTDMMRRHKAQGGFKDLSAPTYGSMIKAYGQAGQMQRVHDVERDGGAGREPDIDHAWLHGRGAGGERRGGGGMGTSPRAAPVRGATQLHKHGNILHRAQGLRPLTLHR